MIDNRLDSSIPQGYYLSTKETNSTVFRDTNSKELG